MSLRDGGDGGGEAREGERGGVPMTNHGGGSPEAASAVGGQQHQQQYSAQQLKSPPSAVSVHLVCRQPSQASSLPAITAQRYHHHLNAHRLQPLQFAYPVPPNPASQPHAPHQQGEPQPYPQHLTGMAHFSPFPLPRPAGFQQTMYGVGQQQHGQGHSQGGHEHWGRHGWMSHPPPTYDDWHHIITNTQSGATAALVDVGADPKTQHAALRPHASGPSRLESTTH